MKKVIALILCLAMALCLFVGCGSNGNDDKTDETAKADESTAPESEAPESENADSDLAYIQEKGTMVIGITDYEPMNYRDDNGEWTGFDTEFAQAVGEKLGVDVEFIEIDWDNKTMELETKSIDAVWNGMTLTDDVLSAMECTDAYIRNAQVLVAAADVIDQYTDAESLADLNLAAEAGSAGETAIKENGLSCTAVSTQADALMEVASGSADACVIDITMAKAMTGEGTSYADLTYGLELTSEEYGIGFRKGSDMAEAVNEIIKELVEDGTLDQIAEKYELTASLVSNQ